MIPILDVRLSRVKSTRAFPSTTRTTPTALATDEAAAALARRSSTSLPAGGKGDSEHAKSCASSSFERGGPTPCRAVGAPGAYPSSGDCRLCGGCADGGRHAPRCIAHWLRAEHLGGGRVPRLSGDRPGRQALGDTGDAVGEQSGADPPARRPAPASAL